ncbi:MAG: threonine synthase, partial [Acutalibacteraceae bacterium]|nr:threonine synthase [Acutalibacteraceae bacterium]
KAVAKMQADLAKDGVFKVTDEIKAKMSELFYGGCCDDAETLATIGDMFKEYGYLCDTHTAVAVGVYKKYKEATGDERPAVIASTASPYKFADSVLTAVTDKKTDSEFGNVRLLSEVTSTEIPAPIKALENAEVRFKEICEKDKMLDAVYSALQIK